MTKRERYEPGTFSWVDLGTTDLDGAKQFYSSLFGWQADDQPVGEGMVYSMQQIGGDNVAAIYEMSSENRERDVPPNWLSYVSVEDADAAAAKAKELGATIHAEPFDVMDAGRMSVIQDPEGAMFAVWQPNESIGSERVNEPGCLTWNELNSHDIASAAVFYTSLFGWDAEPMDTGDAPPYSVILNAGQSNGGFMGLTEQHGDMPAHWLPYFVVESTDDAVERVKELGGELLAGPMDVPTGRIAAVRDPQGAAFALWQGEVNA
jgi:uncharacterized protein